MIWQRPLWKLTNSHRVPRPDKTRFVTLRTVLRTVQVRGNALMASLLVDALEQGLIKIQQHIFNDDAPMLPFLEERS